MRLTVALSLILTHQAANAFMVVPQRSSRLAVYGYLDDLSKDLYAPDPDANPVDDSKEATNMKKEDVDRGGVGSWEGFVDFDEFDGGDGQMGVAGDGNKGLEKIGTTSHMAKSKTMSAKNAWGKSTGYADTLIDQGMEATRAQQMENWKNQQEVLEQRKQQRYMTDGFDQVKQDEDWRSLASFGAERVQDFDLEETFGPVVAGEIDEVIQISAPMNQNRIHEISLKNPYMGFADFRAAFTSETNMDWTVEPKEGSLKQREATDFVIRFRANNPGVSEGHLVIETEDFKKTYKVIGSTA